MNLRAFCRISCLILVLCAQVSAHGNTIDSLKNVLALEKQMPEKIMLAYKLGFNYSKADQFDRADSIIEVGLNWSREHLLKKEEATGYLYRGIIGFRAIQPYDRISTSFLESLAIFESINDSVGIGDCNLQLGVLNYLLETYKEAAANFETCARYYPENAASKATARYLLGLCYSELGRFKEAEELLTQSLTDYAANDHDREILVRAFIGKLLCNQKKYNESIELLENLFGMYDDLPDTATYSVIRAFLSSAYLGISDWDQVIANAENAIENIDLASGIGYWLEAASNLHQAYAKKGEMDRAYEILVSWKALSDSVAGSRVLDRMITFKAKYDFEKEIIQQKAERDVQVQTQLRKQRRTRDIGLGTSILAFILAGGFFLRWRFVRRAKNIIEKERDRSDHLLLNILPEEIATELKEKGQAEARDCEHVSILFTDIQGFTKLAEQMEAKELVSELNHCFKAFDHICEEYSIEKIKTIGDSFMAAGGLPIPNIHAAKNTVKAAIAMADFVLRRKADREAEGLIGFDMRTGVHTGNVVAGIIGVKKFQYDIWGDTVNTASRMETYGETGKVNISKATYEVIKDDPDFRFEKRGIIEAKGKGAVEMYFVKLA